MADGAGGERVTSPGYEEYLADLAELRQNVYGLLGSLFLYPRKDDIAELLVVASELRRRIELADSFPFFPLLRALLELVERFPDEEGGRLEEEYVDLFVVGAAEGPCPPYESVWVDRRGLERGLVVVEVERAYATSGVALASTGELPDHAALELAFLSLLCGEEVEAWREVRVERAADCLRRQGAFHDRHLERWFPAFTRRLRRVAAPTSFYGVLAKAAHAFVVHDRDLIQALTAL